jgi:hypothetical protein
MIDPTTQIAITLTAQQWDVVLQQLSAGPYRMVAEIMATIQRQCMEHDAPMRVAGGANGAEAMEERTHG